MSFCCFLYGFGESKEQFNVPVEVKEVISSPHSLIQVTRRFYYNIFPIKQTTLEEGLNSIYLQVLKGFCPLDYDIE